MHTAPEADALSAELRGLRDAERISSWALFPQPYDAPMAGATSLPRRLLPDHHDVVDGRLFIGGCDVEALCAELLVEPELSLLAA